MCIRDMQSGNIASTKSSLSGQICVSIKSSHILFTGITGHGWMPTSIESTLYFNVAIGGENVNG